MIRSERCKVGVIKSFGRFRSNQPVKQKTEFSDENWQGKKGRPGLVLMLRWFLQLWVVIIEFDHVSEALNPKRVID